MNQTAKISKYLTTDFLDDVGLNITMNQVTYC